MPIVITPKPTEIRSAKVMKENIMLIFLSKVFLTETEIKPNYAQMIRQMCCRYIMINFIKTGSS